MFGEHPHVSLPHEEDCVFGDCCDSKFYPLKGRCSCDLQIPHWDLLPRERCKGKDDALVMAEVALAKQDPGIMHDLRILNGRPKSKMFDVY